uniref:Insulin-induced gene protein n=1 Tax=Suricata suricatta TaxID=37032 RepID=A0A673THD9_SURSU
MAEGETESPGPKRRGPYISSVTSRSVNLMIRGVVLFFIGVFLALVLNLLQIQRNVTLFPPDVIASIFSSAWWVPPCCGTASAAIGLLYPCIDRHLGEPHKFKREWSSVMRCVAVFVGINHASAVSFRSDDMLDHEAAPADQRSPGPCSFALVRLPRVSLLIKRAWAVSSKHSAEDAELFWKALGRGTEATDRVLESTNTPSFSSQLC